MNKTRKIILSFNRDFNQWINQLVRDQHVFNFPKVWGLGLSDQITHFDGRTFEWWRYQDEMKKIKEHIAHLSLKSELFSARSIKNFLRLVKQLKKLANQSVLTIQNPVKHLRNLEGLFNSAYPWYPLSIFISGPWRRELVDVHGHKANAVIKRFIESRKQSEGLPNIIGDHLRRWLGHYLENSGLPGDWVKLLSVEEIRSLVQNKVLPPVRILKARAKGFVYFNGHIFLVRNFVNFLTTHKLEAVDYLTPKIKNLKGVVAFPGGKRITGKVQVIFNTAEAKKFIPGAILVTPMTVPTFLPAVKKAKAIITDEGGLLCHAAIVARELKKPCVIGTKAATKVFKDGDLVEVDAERGIVKKI